MPPKRILRRSVLGPLLLLCLHTSLSAQNPHCGTGLWMERRPEQRRVLKRSTGAKAAAAVKPVRTLETAHFLIHYVMRGANQVRLASGDQGLKSLVDSLYAALPNGISVETGDSAVYATLQARHAAHPRYITTMAGYFEAAYRYYVDTLGMRAPSETAPSVYFEAPASPAGKYPVDVADIGTADPGFRGQEIYALTYPTGYGGMLMENDFLFNTRLPDPNGIPVGDSISSRYRGKLVHNYAAEWDLGLKVTCYHELYHGVQFAYTPNEMSFHLWYETSATGMEERKAPEVNDYLQYLPAYMDDLGTKGMRAFPDGGLSRYGNGIYHLFLTRELGEDFDVKLWQRLTVNGNNIEPALEFVYAAYGKSSQEVYSRYGAQLAFAGTDARNPLPAFSDDIPLWPRLQRDSVDLLSTAAYAPTQRHPPLSIRALVLSGSGMSGKALFQADTLLRTVLARLRPDTSTVEILRGRIVPLDMPGSGGETQAVLVNGSMTTTSNPVEIRLQTSRPDTAVYPYPNPINRSGGEIELTFSRLDRAATIDIYTETGLLLRELAFTAANTLWSWDLEDGKGLQVKPGIYYYRVDAGALRPLYIR